MTWGVNDYPYRNGGCGGGGLCGGYATRNCTDFCMWRITNDLRHPCIGGLGDARFWASAARARGFAVDGNVRQHDVAVFPPGNQGASSAGHVAMVLQVLGGGAWIAEQYNYGTPEPCCCYTNNVRFGSGGVEFIHIAGGGPPPPPVCPTCTGGQVCNTATGTCVCPPGTTLDAGRCTSPQMFPGSVVGIPTVPFLLGLGTLATLGVYELHARGHSVGEYLHRPEGSEGFRRSPTPTAQRPNRVIPASGGFSD